MRIFQFVVFAQIVLTSLARIAPPVVHNAATRSFVNRANDGSRFRKLNIVTKTGRITEMSAQDTNPDVFFRTPKSPLDIPRGGSCDTDAALFTKVGVSAALETAALFGVIAFGQYLSFRFKKIPKILDISVIQWISLLVVIFFTSFIGSFVDGSLSAATRQVLEPNVVPGDPNWYANLNRPWWEPPGWVFPIMWLIVSKPTQLAALIRVWKKSTATAVISDNSNIATTTATAMKNWPALAVYCAHLSLGDAWNKVFFGYQCTGRGAAIITTFFLFLLTSAVLFASIDQVAGLLMLPTCAWVCVATALNWSIYLQN